MTNSKNSDFNNDQMGKNHSKNNEIVSANRLLTSEEFTNAKILFRLLCRERPTEGCTPTDIQSLCRWEIDPKLTHFILHYFYTNNKNKIIDLNTFLKCFTHMVRGSIDDKSEILMGMLVDDMNAPVSLTKLMDYLESVVSSYMLSQRKTRCKEYFTWRAIRCTIDDHAIKRLADSFCHELYVYKNVYLREIEWWVMSWTTLAVMQSFVFSCLYQIEQSLEIDENGETKNQTLFPLPKLMGKPHKNLERNPSMLDLCSVVHINYSLPKLLRQEWRLLYSSIIHGESFSKLLERIFDQGPTVLVVKDKSGYMFGCFAPEGWKLSPTFYGDASAFIFTLKPKMRIFEASGKNENHQYLNIKSKTLPNGLGMGGQLGYFGLWLSAEYGRGCSSEACSTYFDFHMISSTKQFEIHRIEMWGVGEAPRETRTRHARSTIWTEDSVFRHQNSSMRMGLPMAGFRQRRFLSDTDSNSLTESEETDNELTVPEYQEEDRENK